MDSVRPLQAGTEVTSVAINGAIGQSHDKGGRDAGSESVLLIADVFVEVHLIDLRVLGGKGSQDIMCRLRDVVAAAFRRGGFDEQGDVLGDDLGRRPTFVDL